MRIMPLCRICIVIEQKSSKAYHVLFSTYFEALSLSKIADYSYQFTNIKGKFGIVPMHSNFTDD